jgi:hypothetical protein
MTTSPTPPSPVATEVTSTPFSYAMTYLAFGLLALSVISMFVTHSPGQAEFFAALGAVSQFADGAVMAARKERDAVVMLGASVIWAVALMILALG